MSEVKVHVKSPLNAAGFSLEMTVEDTFSTVKQYLLALGLLEQPLSAFTLTHKGQNVANDTPLGSIASPGSELVLEMKLQQLTMADVNFQLEQLREALGLSVAGSTCVNGGATKLHEIKRTTKKSKKLNEEEIAGLAGVPEISSTSSTDGEANLGGRGRNAVTDSSVVALPNQLAPKPSAIELKLSRWQPLCRSPQIKLQGILAFLYLISNDSKEWHFVATPQGFAYVPSLKNDTFKLPPSLTSALRYTPTLIQTIEQVSSSTINAARKNSERIKADPLSCVPVPQVLGVAPWLVGDVPSISSLNVSNFEQPAEQSLRDWNEDYQSTRELNMESFSERIMRDRSLCHTATEFATAATEGVIKIVEGAITALNPFEDVESAKLYLSNGIFYTDGADFSQSYAGIYSEEAAKKAVKKGINGIEQLMMLNNPQLCPVLTAVVDYCGRRLVAQAPVPGIFREIPLIVYGQSEDADVVHSSAEVDEHMEQFASHLHLKKHPVNPEGVELQTSAEVHCAKSTDGRFYAIDLHRMQVPDLMFPASAKGLDLIRFEALVDYFAQNPEAEKLNPDVWMAPEKFPKEYAESQLPKDIEAIKLVGKYIRETLVPALVTSVAEGTGVDPLDGNQLTSLMHRKGINMRHLGLVHSLALAAGARSLAAVALEEAIARSLKVQLRAELEKVESISFAPEAVEKFVAEFRLPSKFDGSAVVSAVEQRLVEHFGFNELPASWKETFLPRLTLLRLLSLKTGFQWDEKLKLVAVNPIVRFSFPRSLTAADAIEAGRMSLEAAVNPQSSATPESEAEGGDGELKAGQESEKNGNEHDHDHDHDHEQEHSEGGAKENSPSPELLEQTLSVVSQAVGIFTQIYGSSHAEVAQVLNQVATLYYEYGNDTDKAIDYVRKAITIAERVKGIDSYEVIVMYNNLAYFERAANNWLTTIEISRHIISLVDQIAWPGFSDASNAFETVAVMLLQSQKKKLQAVSLDWFKQGLELAKQRPTGPSGLLWFQYAQAQIFQEDYKNASRSMESSYSTFKAKNGPEDPSTKEVKNYLEQLLKITVSTAQHRTRAISSLNSDTQLKSTSAKKHKKRSNKKKPKAANNNA